MISVPPISKCGPELKIRASPPNFFKQCSQKSTGPAFHRICEELLEIFSKILLCVVHCTISTAVEQRFPILGFILVHRFTGSARNSWRYSIRYYWIVQPEQGDKNVYCPINSTNGRHCRCGNMKSTYSISWLELSGFRKKSGVQQFCSRSSESALYASPGWSCSVQTSWKCPDREFSHPATTLGR